MFRQSLFTAFCLALLNSPTYAKNQDIRVFDFKSYFNSKYSECLEGRKEAVGYDVEYHDFGKDGREEAIVVGWSCYTGTAGPDIHSVYRLDSNANLKELEFKENGGNIQTEGAPLTLIGNVNYHLVTQDGMLCEEWHDGSSRERPLTRCYELVADTFKLKRVSYSPLYEPSFDCSKARSDREIAVCGDKRLAALDRELSSIYRQRVAQADKEMKSTIISSQRDWLRQLDNWRAYKFCCEDIAEAYEKRISELQTVTAAKPNTIVVPENRTTN